MRRKRIATLLAGLNREYQRDFICGMTDEAKAQDIDLCLFACQGATGSNMIRDVLCEASIFDLPDLSDFDGITALCATVTSQATHSHLLELLAAQASKPQVMIDSTAPQAVSITFDDEISVRELTRHLVEDHGYRRFKIITGPRNNPIADKRLYTCADTLAQHGITLGENDVYDGLWVREGGQTAMREILADGAPLPDAIMCGNDDMAFGVIDVLEEQGYHVPEDVCVTGFDAKREALGRGLTTIRRPVRDAGMLAVRVLSQWIDGVTPEKQSIVLDTQLICGESCACPNTSVAPRIRSLVRTLSEEHTTMERSLQQTSSFSNALAAVMGKTEAGEVLNSFASRWRLNEFHICVEPGFFHSPTEECSHADNQQLLLSSYSHGNTAPQQLFDTKLLLPMLQAERSSSVVLVFSPLYYLEKVFGYAVLDVEFASTLTLNPLLTTLSSSLMGLRMQSRVRSYANALEELSVRDSLTGLLNRRGYLREAPRKLQEAIVTQQHFMMLSADMDGMKLVNDRFGHLAGDKAIVRMGNAIRALEDMGLTCVHISGDEFLAFGVVQGMEAAHQASVRLQQSLDRINDENPWVFRVQASVGVYCTIPMEGCTIEDFQSQADHIMYENKRVRKMRIARYAME